jgi:hypothetical protein
MPLKRPHPILIFLVKLANVLRKKLKKKFAIKQKNIRKRVKGE